MSARVIIYLIALALPLFSFAAHANKTSVNDPMKYSEDKSKLYAEGDSNDSSGWEGCGYVDSDSNTQIYCTGIRDILVHGGTMVSSSFTCEFTFIGNIVTSEICL